LYCPWKTTMTSGQDVSEYLDTLGLVKSYFSSFFRFFFKKIEKKNCLGAPTTQRIRRFACLQDCFLTLTCHLAPIYHQHPLHFPLPYTRHSPYSHLVWERFSKNIIFPSSLINLINLYHFVFHNTDTFYVPSPLRNEISTGNTQFFFWKKNIPFNGIKGKKNWHSGVAQEMTIL
jgi:hypothetical protein